MLRMLRVPALWALGGAYFGLKLIRYSLLFWLPYFLEKDLHYDKETAGYLSTTFELGGIVGVILVGFISDRWFTLNRSRLVAPMLFALAGALLLYHDVGSTGIVANGLAMALCGFLLFGPDAPTGVYGELRLVIDGAWLEVAGSGGLEVYATKGMEGETGATTVHELKTPSWDASGLKLKLPDGKLVVDGTQRFLLIDFDLAESVRAEAGGGAWVMSPVTQVNDISLTTAIHFDVSLPVELTLNLPIIVELYDREGYSEGSLTLSDPDHDNVYSATFLFVDPSEGPFHARIVTADGFELTTTPSALSIEGRSGGTVQADFQVVAILAN